MNAKVLMRLAAQLTSVYAVSKGLRRAQSDGDSLRLVEAALQAAAVAVTVVIIVREFRKPDSSLETALEAARP